MVFTEKQRKEFKEVVKPLMKFMNDNCHPHVTTVVNNTRAELSEGITVFVTKEYLKD